MRRTIAALLTALAATIAMAATQVGPAAAASAPCTVAPTVHTSATTNVIATGATAQGTVNPNGCATTYQFEYGGTAAYGAATTSASAGAGTTAGAVSATLAGLAPQTTYHVRLVATSAAGPTDGGDVTFTTPPSCAPGTGTLPAVVTSAPSSITATDATLRGTVNPESCATTYDFEYGTTTAYGSKTAVASAGSGASVRSVSAAISGLAAHTTYHARLVATSAVGTTDGPDVTFTTAVSCAPHTGSEPTVVTRPATSLTVSGAKLTGAVTPNGCATTYHFEYGGTPAYGATTASHSAGSSTAAVAVSASIAKLMPATTYHFRLVATSASGTTDGNDVSFTTPADCRAGKSAPPAAVTTPATAVGNNGATLTAAINPRGCATTYHFDYGLTTAYGSSTATAGAGAGTAAVPAAAAITGLAAGTVFHYRVVAVSATGTTDGADRSFLTAAPAAPPTTTIPSPTDSVGRGGIARVTLGCNSGGAPCHGTLRLFRNHRLIGHRGYTVNAGARTVVAVRLNRRGRRMFGSHRRRLVEVVARGNGRVARRYVTAVRRFGR
jgi:hypothetical protein